MTLSRVEMEMPDQVGHDKLVAKQFALRRKKMCRCANIRGRRPNPCERDEHISGAVGCLMSGF